MTIAEQIKGLKEQRGTKATAIDTLAKVIETRAFNAEESTQYNALKAEIESFNQRIAVLEESEKRALQNATPFNVVSSVNTEGEKGEQKKMTEQYSFKRALQSIVERRGIDGVEAEFNVEQRKELRESGISPSGSSIMVPYNVFAKREKRDMDATTGTAGPSNQGSYTIQTNIEGMVDVFLPHMVLGKLPVVRMNNLRGNVSFPQAQTLPSAGWNTENGTATEKTPLLNRLNLSPKRLAAKIQLSNQLLIQSESNISAYARRFLVQASAIEFEKSCLKGGGSNEPTGILGGSYGSTIYAGGAATNGTNASGARPVWDDIVNLVKSTKAVNAPDGQAYITSPAIAGRLQITPRQSSGIEGNFILPNWNSGVNGFPLYSTTNLPDTFSKGGSTVLSAIIFGDFSNFVTASWGGMEIGVDPYTNMAEGQTNLVLGSYLDCGMLNPYGFSAGVDFRSY